ETFNAAGTALLGHLRTLSAQGQQPGAITLNVGQAPDVAGELARLLAERERVAAAEAASLAAKVKLLSDTIAADQSLSDEQKAKVLAQAQPLVHKDMGDAQITTMATTFLAHAQEVSAAVQLATMGYRPPSGSVHITVDSSNGIKALQEQIDRRLNLTPVSHAVRFQAQGGKPLAANVAFAEKALAQFDAENGHRLVAEHKMLAGGVGTIADAAVPAVVERTVLREQLYMINGLNFVDVGTYGFANVVNIPYSYRDTSAAGVAALRTYEGQGIQRAGVIQKMDEARPIPQKLAFRVTNEMRYLLAAAPIDFDPVAENVANIIRMTSEDTDKIINNEILRAADEALVSALNDTLTAQVNGTNKIFVTTQFPVVRPRRIFDM
ncbi:MAG: hypothetical protein K2W93_15935, partial [Burkholderiaceae bacterium]|nr:hypothetical protein [Burkholderiaceae bacterium]